MERSKVIVEEQEFTLMQSQAVQCINFIRPVVDTDTGATVNTNLLSLVLEDGSTLIAPIDAFSRAAGMQINPAQSIVLKGCTVEYYESSRIAGKQFRWRPTDANTVTATSTDKFRTVHNIELDLDKAQKRLALLAIMPAYQVTLPVVHNTESVTPPETKPETASAPKLPTGAKKVG